MWELDALSRRPLPSLTRSWSSQGAAGHHCLLQPRPPAGEAAGQRASSAGAAGQRDSTPEGERRRPPAGGGGSLGAAWSAISRGDPVTQCAALLFFLFFLFLFEPSAGWNCNAEEGTHAHEKGWWNINEDCCQRLAFFFLFFFSPPFQSLQFLQVAPGNGAWDGRVEMSSAFLLFFYRKKRIGIVNN